MNTTTASQPRTVSRCAHLTTATDALHESLHARVNAADPFADRMRFGLWLNAQYRFQQTIEPFYRRDTLNALLPGLAERSRLPAVVQDMADLDLSPPAGILRNSPDDEDDAAAFGWLFVAEGSTLGAAMLLKRAHALGLSETYGARHLAPAPIGRARHWKQFTRTVNELALDADQEHQMQAAALAAFQHFGELLDDTYALRRT